MNYSTLKKTVVLSAVSLMAIGFASAQTTMTTTAKSDSTGTAKMFGGTNQFATWSIGLNLGYTTPKLLQGGTDATRKAGTVAGQSGSPFGYGLSIRDKIASSVSIQFDWHGGKVVGHDSTAIDVIPPGIPESLQKSNGFDGQAFSTKYNTFTLSGLINVASVDYFHRKNWVNIYASAGMGVTYYQPTYFDNYGNQHVYGSGVGATNNKPGTTNYGGTIAKGTNGSNAGEYNHTVKELDIPLGVSAKFKLTDAFALNIGYTENFIDGTNFSGFHTIKSASGQIYHDHYAYAYAGVEYTLGTSSKANLDWVNPVAIMYDELYDEALRREVAALKARVGKVEDAINDLKKDSDGDGVADQFDKCPNTPAGTVVDGSGCPIVFPKFNCDSCHVPVPPPCVYCTIQFDFDSSILKTVAYPILDATSADLKKTGGDVELDGFASSEGTAAHNLRLSRDRANAVKTYLVNSGVEAKKLKVKAYGETHPVADNSTEEGRIKNRRVEFKRK